jgi:uncharacterized protein (DUF3084 family)
MLSIFEQQFFIDDKKTVKDYEYPLDDENMKAMVEVLRHAAADTKTKREMEEAWWAELSEREYESMEVELAQKNRIISEKDKTLAEKDKSLAEKDKSLAEKERVIEELKQLLSK